MKVIANAKGYYGGRIYEVGEEFAFDGKTPGKWMTPVVVEKQEKVTPPPAPSKKTASVPPGDEQVM